MCAEQKEGGGGGKQTVSVNGRLGSYRESSNTGDEEPARGNKKLRFWGRIVTAADDKQFLIQLVSC